MAHEKALSTKEDLLTAISESWNNFDKEYCFKLVNTIPERIKTVIKAQGRSIETLERRSITYHFQTLEPLW